MDVHGEQISYKVKTIDFMNRRVPIMMQNENGPCPLLALANVLLLRNRITLSSSTNSVTQERLISLVAGHLLDCNDEQRLARMDSDTRANLRQNIADAITQVPKLATGLDVNVRFQDIRGFEFTQDTAIFDLLDVRLLHGWLVDPQDQATAECISHHSYNELVSLIVDCLGEDATPLQTPKAKAGPSPDRRGPSERHFPAESKPPGSSGASASTALEPPLGCASGAGAAGGAEARGGGSSDGAVAQEADSRPVDADALSHALQDVHMDDEESRELQEALALSMVDTGPVPTAHAMPPPPPFAPGEEGKTLQAHSSPANDPAPPANTPAAAPPLDSKPPAQPPTTSAPQSLGEEDTPISPSAAPPSPAPAEGVESDVGASTDAFSDLNPLTKGAEHPGSEGEGATLVGSEASSSSGGREASGTGNPGPAPREEQAEALSSGSHSGAGVRSQPGQPPEARQYSAAALAKGKMPAYTVLPSALLEERKVRLQEEAEAEAAGSAALEDVQAYKQSEKRAQEMQRATLIQAFFNRTSSQLTEHGLLALHQGMRSNELGVLFRNNHFNTLFAHNGAIWMLATDQGYLFEDVVWERLSDVQGNNEFCRADFTPFVKRSPSANVHAAQEAFASGMGEQGPPGPDADLALALQMQDEENQSQERFLEQQRGEWQEQARQHREPQAAPGGGGPPPRPRYTSRRGAQRPSNPSPQPGGLGGNRLPRRGEAKAKKSSVCSIM